MTILAPPDPLPPLEGIDSEEYKVETCSITGQDCDGYNCRSCDTARKQAEQDKAEQEQAEEEEYTVFLKKAKIEGLEVRANSSNILAYTDICTLKALQEKGVIPSTTVPYHPDYLKQYPALRKLRHYNNLGIPDEIWADKNKPATFRWGEKYYMIAPIIENGGDEAHE